MCHLCHESPAQFWACIRYSTNGAGPNPFHMELGTMATLDYALGWGLKQEVPAGASSSTHKGKSIVSPSEIIFI